ncbi:MAG: biotin/lipoyl-containing protein [Opitutales bacterium]
MKNLRITVEGKTYEVAVELLDESATAPARHSLASKVSRDSKRVEVLNAAEHRHEPSIEQEGDLVSPLAAVVVSIETEVGATVAAGQNLITLEAMKMNTLVPAHRSGRVESIHVSAGAAVEEGQLLVRII